MFQHLPFLDVIAGICFERTFKHLSICTHNTFLGKMYIYAHMRILAILATQIISFTQEYAALVYTPVCTETLQTMGCILDQRKNKKKKKIAELFQAAL